MMTILLQGNVFGLVLTARLVVVVVQFQLNVLMDMYILTLVMAGGCVQVVLDGLRENIVVHFRNNHIFVPKIEFIQYNIQL